MLSACPGGSLWPSKEDKDQLFDACVFAWFQKKEDKEVEAPTTGEAGKKPDYRQYVSFQGGERPLASLRYFEELLKGWV